MEWATLPLKRYAEFSGRSRRKEYWMFFLLCMVVALVIGFVEGMLGLNNMVGPYGPLSTLFMLAILVPSIAVGIRRLHDTGRSGWWILIALVPLVGGIVLLVFYVLEGVRGPNEYGPDPKGEDLAQTFA
ncbi:MAG TPA: DUF805 domain-containing protein [Allosphingosinicella sp.]|jgi:uncharacterized membrane protein YhaH (DUF805 family)|nr:DUF805 domain-containing protein [Allosphingosinicella sp.]